MLNWIKNLFGAESAPGPTGSPSSEPTASPPADLTLSPGAEPSARAEEALGGDGEPNAEDVAAVKGLIAYASMIDPTFKRQLALIANSDGSSRSVVIGIFQDKLRGDDAPDTFVTGVGLLREEWAAGMVRDEFSD
jgi:hypothetical protein